MSDHAPLPSGFGAGLVRKEEPGPSAPVLTGGFGAVVLSADLSDLNDQQRAAADAPAEGVDLIIAGAGCGKTKTILKRAEKLYFERPGVIGIISFARSVKEELTERIEKTVNPRVASNIKVMTNHAIGLRLVKNNLKTLGLPANTDVVSHDWQIAKLVKDRIEFEAGNPGQRTPHYDLGFNQFTDVQIKALFRAEEKMYAEGIDLTVILGANPNTVGEARDGWKVKSAAETVINSFKKVLKDTPVDRIISFIVWARMVRMLSGKLMFRDLLPLAALLPADCYTIFGFTHVLVDEAQDLSVDQHTVIQKLASVVGSMTFVGDPGQCFVPGTLIETPSGCRKIETLTPGDAVLAASGKGKTQSATIARVHQRSISEEIVTIRTESGKTIKCTKEHALFTQLVPDTNQHFVYLMYKSDLGYRIGTTRGYRSEGSGWVRHGLDVRARQEGADAAWILRSCTSKAEALTWEQIYSVKYGIPELCFRVDGFAELIQQDVEFVFENLDTEVGARKLSADLTVDLSHPHWVASYGDRAVVVTYLSYDRNKNTKPSHTIIWETPDEELAMKVEQAGLPVRSAKPFTSGRPRWRISTCRAEYEDARELALAVAQAAGVPLIERFALTEGKAWEMTPAGHIHPGMLVPVSDVLDGVRTAVSAERVVAVSWNTYEGVVYDLDVNGLHNYIANDVVVHNCIYRFSGARPDLFLDIPIRYPGTRTHFLEVNYRSKEPILDLANHVLHNYLGAPLSLLPNGAQKGDPIEVLDATRVNLVNWLGDLRYQKGVHWRDISVLFRGNAQAIDVEIALANANIPYNCWSGSFFEHKATDDYMAYIRFFGGDAPVQQDWETIVGHMKFLGKKSAEESWAATSDPKKLLTAPAPAACRSGAQKKRWSELQTFCRMLVAAMQPGNAGGDYLTLIAEHVKTTWEDRWADDPEKLEDARSIGEAFKAWAGVRRPADILDDMERMNSQDPDGVTLSTVHKFKGLERDYTGLWFVGLGPRDGMSKFPKTFMSSDQQEEMCIFYVGATRPRLGLTIFRGWTKTKEDPEPVPMTLPYGIEELFCTTGLLFARHGTQTACELCEHQFNCLARKR